MRIVCLNPCLLLVQAANWNSDVAFNDYLDCGGESTFNPPSSIDQAKLRQLFDRYRDWQNQDIMLAEGVEAFCQDLQVWISYKMLLNGMLTQLSLSRWANIM